MKSFSFEKRLKAVSRAFGPPHDVRPPVKIGIIFANLAWSTPGGKSSLIPPRAKVHVGNRHTKTNTSLRMWLARLVALFFSVVILKALGWSTRRHTLLGFVLELCGALLVVFSGICISEASAEVSKTVKNLRYCEAAASMRKQSCERKERLYSVHMSIIYL